MIRDSNFLESIDRENKAIFNNGIKEGIERIIQKMLKMQIPESQIAEMTDYSEKKIKEIKKRFLLSQKSSII